MIRSVFLKIMAGRRKLRKSRLQAPQIKVYTDAIRLKFASAVNAENNMGKTFCD